MNIFGSTRYEKIDGKAVRMKEICTGCGRSPQAPEYDQCIGCGKTGYEVPRTYVPAEQESPTGFRK